MTIHINQNLFILIGIGFFIGLVARALMPGRDNLGCVLTTGLGIVGAVVGGFAVQQLGLAHQLGQMGQFIAAVLGAILILALLRLIADR